MRFTASCDPRFLHGLGQIRATCPTPICQGAAYIAVWPARKSRPGKEKSAWYGPELWGPDSGAHWVPSLGTRGSAGLPSF